MKCILVSGLDAPADGNGLDALRAKIQALHPDWECKLIHWTDQIDPADIYIAHSYGVSSVIRYLRFENDRVSLLVLLDGVPEKPGEFWLFTQLGSKEWIIPDNVERAVSFHRAAVFPPYSRPIQNSVLVVTKVDVPNGTITTRNKFTNYSYFWATHNSIPRSAEIHEKILGML